MHHRPSGPPLAARVSGALTSCSWGLRAALRRTVPARLGRFAAGAVLMTTVVALVLAIPVIEGVGAPAVELDSSSTTSPPRDVDSPVVMGLDGRPVSSADFAGVTTSGAAPSTPAPTSGTVAADDPAGDPLDEGAVEPPATGTTGSAPETTPASEGTTSAPASAASSTPPATTRPTPPVTTRPTTPAAPAPPPAEPAAPAEPGDRGEPAESPDGVAEPAAEVLALVNAERGALGCSALVVNDGLATAAQAHSAAMSASGVLRLDGPRGAVAQGADAQSVVAGWLSDAAGVLLLDCSTTRAGVAVVDGWWTALLT